MNHYVFTSTLYDTAIQTTNFPAIRVGAFYYVDKAMMDRLLVEHDFGAQTEIDIAASATLAITPAQIVDNVRVDDFLLVNLTDHILELPQTLAAGWRITHTTGSVIQVQGALPPLVNTSMWIYNDSEDDLSIKKEWASTPEASRILSSGNHTLAAYNFLHISYDFSKQRWIVLTRP